MITVIWPVSALEIGNLGRLPSLNFDPCHPDSARLYDNFYIMGDNVQLIVIQPSN